MSSIESLMNLYENMMNLYENKNNNGDIIVVNSYADTMYKKDILKSSISQFKKIGIDILLVSHYPVSDDIQSLVNYYIYDERNELFGESNADLYWYENSSIYFQTRRVGIGRQSFAVLRSIQNAVYFSKHLGKSFFYHFDYDCVISDADIKNILEVRRDIDKQGLKGYLQLCEQGNGKDIKRSAIVNFFAFYIDFFEDKYGYRKDILDYKKSIDNHMLEFYMYNNVKEHQSEILIEKGDSYKIERFPNSVNDICVSSSNSNVVDVVEEKHSGDLFVVIVCEEEEGCDYIIEYSSGNNVIKTNIRLEYKCSYYNDVSHYDNIVVFKGSKNIYGPCNLNERHNFKLGSLNLKNEENHFICFDSSSLGDNLAWIPYVEEYRKENNCKVVVSTFWNDLFKKEYPEIEFVGRGEVVHDIARQYNIGWYSPWNPKRNPNDFRTIPLQQTATDILGLDYKEIVPRITIPNKSRNIKEKYVCIGIHSTAQAKYWNYENGWQKIVDYLNKKGYKVVHISKEQGNYMGNTPPNGILDKTGDYPIEDRIVDLKNADMFIGIGSGLSWLSWAVGTPTIMISGFSEPFCEPRKGIERLHNSNVCNSCFNDPKIQFDPGDWMWCPRGKDFECSKAITPDMVIEAIDRILFNK